VSVWTGDGDEVRVDAGTQIKFDDIFPLAAGERICSII
jgi:hypothetical protein